MQKLSAKDRRLLKFIFICAFFLPPVLYGIILQAGQLVDAQTFAGISSNPLKALSIIPGLILSYWYIHKTVSHPDFIARLQDRAYVNKLNRTLFWSVVFFCVVGVNTELLGVVKDPKQYFLLWMGVLPLALLVDLPLFILYRVRLLNIRTRFYPECASIETSDVKTFVYLFTSAQLGTVIVLALSFILPTLHIDDSETLHSVLYFNAFLFGGMALVVSVLSSRLMNQQVNSLQSVFDQAHAATQEVKEAEERRVIEEGKVKEQRAQELEKLATLFEGNVGQTVSLVSQGFSEINKNTAVVSTTSSCIAQDVDIVSQSALGTSSKISAVTAAMEEFSAALAEINHNTQKTKEEVATAFERAHTANAVIAEMEEVTHRIDQVVALIQDIAQQTNLLALNAAIESQRAGEAGKGFAVVAKEVKALASQTAEATESIAEQVQAVQGAASRSIHSFGEVEAVLETIQGVIGSIADAVDQQNLAVEDIAQNLTHAETDVITLSDKVANVASSTKESGDVSRNLEELVTDMTRETLTLKTHVDDFLTSVRS